jgi:hypothetical protein
MFESEAGAYPSEAPSKGSTLVGGSLFYSQTLTRLERPARDKHSSLLQTYIEYGCKIFIAIIARDFFSKPFTARINLVG